MQVTTQRRLRQQCVHLSAAAGAAAAVGLITIAQRAVLLGDPHDCTDSADTVSLNSAIFDALVRSSGQT
jgi:hypothetical protein